jgi:hypothetical protein
MPDYVEKQTGIKPHVGLWKRVDKYPANYSVFPEVNQVQVFTSRGCINKCEFCAVKDLEPSFYIDKMYKRHIKVGMKSGEKKLITIQDNNFCSTPWSHQKEVIGFLSTNYPNIKVDFNSAFDCRVFKGRHANLYKKIYIEPIRFAFDGMHEDGYIQKAMSLVKRYNMKGSYVWVYCLYNFEDTPADLYYRMKEVCNFNYNAIPLRYMPLDALDRKYVGKHWTKKMLRNFLTLLWRCSNNATIATPSGFRRNVFGSNGEEFEELLRSNLESNKLHTTYIKSKRMRESGLGFQKKEVDKIKKYVKVRGNVSDRLDKRKVKEYK